VVEPVSPSSPGAGGDWPTQAADAIERAVETVRSKTSQPLLGVASWIVYGLLAAIVGLTAGIVAVIALVRVLNIILPSGVWLPDVILGGIFTAGGLVLWSRRRPRSSAD
jgi:tetrahydromethanopterin S-methyltransferase subunit F